jgi:fatty acid kinase fatty acid binding subunit
MIKIVTDSTASLPQALIREHDIRVVPLYVHFGEQAYKEGIDITNEQFYERLRVAATLPTTSQPSVGEFLEVFKELTDAGHELVVLTISSKLSGTWNSAMGALEMLPGAPISVIDSLCTSLALRQLVEAALEQIAQGATRQQVVDYVEQLKGKLHILFVVDTLEYLAKGGRIGNAKAFLGTLIKIKPILILENGVIEPCEQVRTKGKAVARMLEMIEERLAGQGPKAHVALVHAMALDEALAFRKQVVARLGCAEPPINELGPVIGAHTGPGVVAISAYV